MIPSMALCRGSNSVVRTSTVFFFFFRFQTYKCTLHTKQSLYYICCYLSRIYAIRSLSLSHKYFLLYSYLLPFAHYGHAHKYCTPNARIRSPYTCITFTLHTCSQRNTHYSRVTLYNCIII